MKRIGLLAAALPSALATLVACGGPDGAAGTTGDDGGAEGTTTDGGGAEGSATDASSGGDAGTGADATDGGDAADAGPDFPPQNANDPRVLQLLAYARSQIASTNIPGLAFAVVVNGKLFYAGGVGVKKLGGSDPVDAHTLFRAASMSKMIAAATVESLAQDGMIDTSHPITDYSTDLVLSPPFQASQVKIEHLLSHTAGLPDYAQTICPQSTLMQWFSTPRPLWSAPGTIFDYSNTNYSALGMVVEKITGQSYADVVKSRVFGPAGMTTATFDANAAMAGDHASGTVIVGNGPSMSVVEMNAVRCVAVMPSGGVIASVVDYAHFVEAMLANGGAMLHVDRAAAMLAPYISTHDVPSRSYAFGLDRQDWVSGQPLYFHDGSLGGFNSELGWLPTDKVGIIVMENGDSRMGDAADSVMVYGLTVFARAPTPKQLTTPSSDWVAYPGTYVDSYGRLGTVTVTLGGGGTTVGMTSTGLAVSGTLQQIATDWWSLPGTTLTANFWRNGGGNAGFFVTRSGVGVRQ